MESLLRIAKKVIPRRLFAASQPYYHRSLAFLAALYYGFPSRHIKVIGVTGTKGKSSTTEIINTLLYEAGYQTAVLGTIRFKIAEKEIPNKFKMTMPGRFFVQKFLRDAVASGCQYAIIEMTSEGAKLFRHKHIEMDALVFTNLSPEHIESHGGFENYKNCKLRLRDQLAHSHKQNKYIVVNRDDEHAADFLDIKGVTKLTYSLSDVQPIHTNNRGVLFTAFGTSIHSPLLGKFNIYNLLAGMAVAKQEGVGLEKMKKILAGFSLIKGRAQLIDEGQPFTVVVDYAHTPDSLEAIYKTFPQRKICVLGNAGGGRDTWKRPLMGEIADRYCDQIILTDEDPYDEDPRAIVDMMQTGIKNTPVEIEMDRRLAIRKAVVLAQAGDTVLITGKGTDPYIMRAGGEKEKWSDEQVTRDELVKLKQHYPNTYSHIE